MAGACTDLGVRINSNNQVEAAVDREQAWPYPGTASLKSGTRVDPVTGLLWSPPDQVIKVVEAHASGRTAFPNDTQTVTLTTLSLEMAASSEHDNVMFMFFLAGGYQGYRMGTGNFWATYRILTTYDNGIPMTYSGWEEVGSHENNTAAAGASTGSGSIVDSFSGIAQKPANTRFKVQVTYEMRPLTYSDHPSNAFAWRPPVLRIMQMSMPLDTP